MNEDIRVEDVVLRGVDIGLFNGHGFVGVFQRKVLRRGARLRSGRGREGARHLAVRSSAVIGSGRKETVET
jgi:hypothetical protein